MNIYFIFYVRSHTDPIRESKQKTFINSILSDLKFERSYFRDRTKNLVLFRYILLMSVKITLIPIKNINKLKMRKKNF